MNYVELVKGAATKLNLMDDTGDLKSLDSVTIIDFMFALEAASSRTIPTSALWPETFQSIDSVAGMLRGLDA